MRHGGVDHEVKIASENVVNVMLPSPNIDVLCVRVRHACVTHDSTHYTFLKHRGFQRTRGTSAGEFVNNKALQDVAATAGSVPRDENPHAASLYFSASVSQMFLLSPTGQRELERADAASCDVWNAACAAHASGPGGSVLEYGWAMIRDLHKTGPGPLHLWGRPEHLPSATTPAKRAPIHAHSLCRLPCFPHGLNLLVVMVTAFQAFDHETAMTEPT